MLNLALEEFFESVPESTRVIIELRLLWTFKMEPKNILDSTQVLKHMILHGFLKKTILVIGLKSITFIRVLKRWSVKDVSHL